MKFKRKISALLVGLLLCSTSISPLAQNANGNLKGVQTSSNQMYTIKTLDGRTLTGEEFLSYLYENNAQIIEMESSKSLTGGLIAGSWFVPGVGAVVITLGGAIIVGGATIAIGSALGQKISEWFLSASKREEEFSRFDYHYDKHAHEFADTPNGDGKKPGKNKYFLLAKELIEKEGPSIMTGVSYKYSDRTVKLCTETWSMVIYDTATKYIRTFYVPNHSFMDSFKDTASFVKSIINHFEGITR